MTKKILVFAGSARRDSFNKLFANVGANAVNAAGGEAHLIDMADYPAAIYNQDDEAENGLPEVMKKFKTAIAACDGMLISTPEYNGCVPPLLVNALTWASRAEGDEVASAVFAGKPVALMATSPGGMGGVRVIPRLRDGMCELGCVIVPGFATLAKAYEAFDDQGNLVSGDVKKVVDGLVGRLLAAV